MTANASLPELTGHEREVYAAGFREGVASARLPDDVAPMGRRWSNADREVWNEGRRFGYLRFSVIAGAAGALGYAWMLRQARGVLESDNN